MFVIPSSSFFSQFAAWFEFNLHKMKKKNSFTSPRDETRLFFTLINTHAYTETRNHYWWCQRKDVDLDGHSLHLGLRCLVQRHLSPSESNPAPLLLPSVSLLIHIRYLSNAPVSHLSFHRSISGL